MPSKSAARRGVNTLPCNDVALSACVTLLQHSLERVSGERNRRGAEPKHLQNSRYPPGRSAQDSATLTPACMDKISNRPYRARIFFEPNLLLGGHPTGAGVGVCHPGCFHRAPSFFRGGGVRDADPPSGQGAAAELWRCGTPTAHPTPNSEAAGGREADAAGELDAAVEQRMCGHTFDWRAAQGDLKASCDLARDAAFERH
jgi:hypothetical protein